MKKITAFLLLSVLSLFLFACGSSDTEEEIEQKQEPVLEKSQLTGTWEFASDGDFQQIIIDENGTYRQITSVSGINIDHTDSYVISDNRLILYYDEMGIMYTYKVTFDGADKMNFYNAGNGEPVISYTRKTN